MQARAGWAIVLWALSSVALAGDPLAGRWLGSMGTDKERVPVALEFRQADDGAWSVRFSNPLLNVFDTDAGGTLVRDGDRLHLAAVCTHWMPPTVMRSGAWGSGVRGWNPRQWCTRA